MSDNEIYGMKLRINGLTRRMNQLAANDPKRQEMALKIAQLQMILDTLAIAPKQECNECGKDLSNCIVCNRKVDHQNVCKCCYEAAGIIAEHHGITRIQAINDHRGEVATLSLEPATRHGTEHPFVATPNNGKCSSCDQDH